MTSGPRSVRDKAVTYFDDATNDEVIQQAAFDERQSSFQFSSHRFLDRSKPIAAILAIAGLVMTLLFGRSCGEALGVGGVLGAASVAISLVIYRQAVKAKYR